MPVNIANDEHFLSVLHIIIIWSSSRFALAYLVPFLPFKTESMAIPSQVMLQWPMQLEIGGTQVWHNLVGGPFAIERSLTDRDFAFLA